MLIVGGVILYCVNPIGQPLMPKCVLHELTGLSCPGCGFQRAMHALLHGRLLEAIGYNVFLVVALPYAIALLLVRYVLEPTPRIQRALIVLEGRTAIYLYVGLFTAWFIIRNIFSI